MPGGTGLQVLRQLKNPVKTNQISMIVISGSIDPEMAATVTSLGADEVMTKPPDIERLDANIEGTVEH